MRLMAAELEALAAYAAKAAWPAGFTIYQRGAPADGIFVVTRGHIVLRSRVKAGRGFVPGVAAPGELFGAEGLAGATPYATDARAEEESETLHLSGSRFRAFAREQPQHALTLVGQVMQQYAVLLDKLRELATLSVEQRLVATLLRMAHHEATTERTAAAAHGSNGSNGSSSSANGAHGAHAAGLTLDGTQYRLLCEMVGATRESVSIVVNRLIADGLAERNGGGFVVPNLADLTTRVGGAGRDGELVIPLGIESDNGQQSAGGRATGQG